MTSGVPFRFNPTAIAIEWDGTPAAEAAIVQLLSQHGLLHPGFNLEAAVQRGCWVAVYMGAMMILTPEAMRSAQGIV